MPYGFAQARLKEGIKPSTVKFQVIVVEQFFEFLRRTYKRDVAPNEISGKDVREFLNEQKYEKKYKDATIYRKQSNLKVFFHYLWETKHISHDIMEKFEYFDKPFKEIDTKVNRKIDYDYEYLLEQEQRVLHSKLPDTCKLLMVLYIKGIEVQDMYNFTISNIEIMKDKAEIRYFSKTGYDVLVEYTEEEEVAILDAMVRRAIMRDTPFLLNVKNKEDEYVQSNPLVTRFYMHEIKKLTGINLRAGDVRIVYADYLYNKKKLSIDQIAEILGRNRKHIVNLLDTAIERMSNKKYNQNNAYGKNDDDVLETASL